METAQQRSEIKLFSTIYRGKRKIFIRKGIIY